MSTDDLILTWVFSLHGAIWGGGLILIIYFWIRKRKKEQKEDFEKREN